MISRCYFASVLLGFLAAAGLLAGSFYFQLGVPASTPMSRWSAALNDKKLQIAAEKGTNKIILAAGSSTLFGLKANVIEQETGRKTVNLGSHAALGATYILHLTQKAVQPNDIVILGFEYELYNGDAFEKEGPLIDYVVGHDPDYFRQFRLLEKLQAILCFPLDRIRLGIKYRYKTPKNVTFPEAYAIERLNDCGDLTGITYSGKPEHLNAITNWTSVLATGIYRYQGAFDSLQEFIEWSRRNKVKVLAVFPAIYGRPEYATDQARKSIAEIESFFKEMNVPILGNYTEALLPVENFYDTPYHLTEEAAERRTRLLLPKLKEYLPR